MRRSREKWLSVFRRRGDCGILHTVNGAIWVLLLSGILGFRVGMLGFPDWLGAGW